MKDALEGFIRGWPLNGSPNSNGGAYVGVGGTANGGGREGLGMGLGNGSGMVVGAIGSGPGGGGGGVTPGKVHKRADSFADAFPHFNSKLLSTPTAGEFHYLFFHYGC